MSLSQKCYYCRHYVYGYENATEIEVNDFTSLVHIDCMLRNNYNIKIQNNTTDDNENTEDKIEVVCVDTNSDNED